MGALTEQQPQETSPKQPASPDTIPRAAWTAVQEDVLDPTPPTLPLLLPQHPPVPLQVSSDLGQCAESMNNLTLENNN